MDYTQMFKVNGAKGSEAVDKHYKRKRITKLVIDIVMALLFMTLLGYSFTGGQFHEILGIIFVVAAVLHNIFNFKWYKAIKKGAYSRKRKLITVINLALAIDVAAILITGVINSRYLFDTGIHIAVTTQLHTILALIGFALIVFHIMVHVFSHAKKQYRKLPVVLTALTLIFTVSLHLWILPYLSRHFKTVEVDFEMVIAGDSVDANGKKIVTVYFTRVGNTDFDDDVDAVSGASLLYDKKRGLLGNSQVLAQMVRDAAGGGLVPINVKNRYPSSYYDTVAVASDEMNSKNLPELIDMPENIEEYDTIVLVFPLWWGTIPKPVEAFLSSYDFSGKTLMPIVTHGGGGVGRSIEDIKAACDANVVENPLEVYCDDIPDYRDNITQWLELTLDNGK